MIEMTRSYRSILIASILSHSWSAGNHLRNVVNEILSSLYNQLVVFLGVMVKLVDVSARMRLLIKYYTWFDMICYCSKNCVTLSHSWSAGNHLRNMINGILSSLYNQLVVFLGVMVKSVDMSARMRLLMKYYTWYDIV